MSRLLVVMTCLVLVVCPGCGMLSRRPRVLFKDASSITIRSAEDLQGLGWRPVIEASINGVKGNFLIDTGANGPVLTMKAVRECKIPLSSRTRSVGFVGQDSRSRFRIVEGDVTVEFSDIVITWSDVPVAPGLGSEEWFGLIDYRTLTAAHAIIDLKEKTIKFTP